MLPARRIDEQGLECRVDLKTARTSDLSLLLGLLSTPDDSQVSACSPGAHRAADARADRNRNGMEIEERDFVSQPPIIG